MQYLADAGHGWLEVSLDEYPDAENYGTGFGYLDESKRVIYLEEDCEMVAFLHAYPDAVAGIRYVPVEGDSAVRSLPRNAARMVTK